MDTTTISPKTAEANAQHEAAAAKHQEDAKAAKRGKRNLPAATSGSIAANKMAATASALQQRANDILKANKPTVATLAEADANGIKALREVSSIQKDMDATAPARLGTAWRDIALYMLDSGEIVADTSAAQRLLTHLRQIANEPVVSVERDQIDNEGKMVENVVTIARKTLADTVNRDTCRLAARVACLMAMGSETHVCTGYVPDKGSPAILPGTPVQSGKPNSGKYKLAVAAPAKIIRPVVYYGADDKPNKDGTFNAAFSRANDDDSLRYIDEVMINSLYAIHFDKRKPVYEATSKVRGVQPTGYLTRLPVVKDNRPNQAGTGQGTGAPKLETALAKLGNTPEGAVVALASKVRDLPRKDWGAKDNVAFQAGCFRLATEMLCRAAKDGDLASKTWAESIAATEAALLLDTIKTCVIEPRKDQYRTVVDDKPAQLIKTDNAPVLPEKQAAKEDEKKTAAAD